MAEIVALCRQRRLYFATVTGRRGRRRYVIYRKRPEGDPNPRGIYVAKCDGGERALLNRLKRAAGIEPGRPAPQDEPAL